MIEKILMSDEDQITLEKDELPEGDNRLEVDLTAKISSINLSPLITVFESQTLQEVVGIFKKAKTNSVLVIDGSGNAVGIFTERDLVQRVLLEDLDLNTEIIKNYMTTDPEILEIEDSIAFAMNKLVNSAIKHLPIKCNGKFKYMLVAADLVHYFACISNKSVLNLPPDVHKQTREIHGG